MSREVVFIVKWDPDSGILWHDSEATNLYLPEGNVYDTESGEAETNSALFERGSEYLEKVLDGCLFAANRFARDTITELDPLNLLKFDARMKFIADAVKCLQTGGIANDLVVSQEKLVDTLRHQFLSTAKNNDEHTFLVDYFQGTLAREDLESLLSEFDQEVERVVDWSAYIGDEEYLENFDWHLQEARKWLSNTPGLKDKSAEERAVQYLQEVLRLSTTDVGEGRECRIVPLAGECDINDNRLETASPEIEATR